MSEASENHIYFTQRAQQARESARRAAEPGVRRVHLEMAERYEARSREADPLRSAIRPAAADR